MIDLGVGSVAKRIAGGLAYGGLSSRLSAGLRSLPSILVSATLFFLAACGSKTQPPDQPKAPAKPAPVAADAIYEDGTAAAGIDFVHQLVDGKLSNIMQSDGAGGTVLDYDGDGWMDFYLVNSGPDPLCSPAPAGTVRNPNRLYRNRGNGTFEDVTAKAGVAGSGFGVMAAAADYDNDGRTDLVVVNFGSLILYHNEGNGTFREVTGASGLTSKRAAVTATFLDADRDGFLDLFVANYLVYDPKVPNPPGSSQPYPGPLAYPAEQNILYHNRGDGTFEDISEKAGVIIPNHRAMSVTPIDFDLDGDEDLYVSNDATANLLLVNDGQGGFKDQALERGVALNQFGDSGGSMAASVGDCNGDGLPDLYVTRLAIGSLYINSAKGLFADRLLASGLSKITMNHVAWGSGLLDYDNDGDLDLFIANGDAHFLKGLPSLLLENDGQGNFADITARAGPCFAQEINGRGSGWVDIDNDGQLDILITTVGGRPHLLHQKGDKANHWLMLRLEGTQSNRDGFGALVKVTAGSRSWTAECRCPTGYVFQSDPRLHFGLAQSTKVDEISIRWPSGATQKLTGIQADQVLHVREPGKSRWPEIAKPQAPTTP